MHNKLPCPKGNEVFWTDPNNPYDLLSKRVHLAFLSGVVYDGLDEIKPRFSWLEDAVFT